MISPLFMSLLLLHTYVCDRLAYSRDLKRVKSKACYIGEKSACYMRVGVFDRLRVDIVEVAL